ncbi:unnamed protein product [Allacma fusca]|uniref:Uncharacterized protein n=1 Tax=Allacma fusca TaxID=39272 RepID=A0A8J2LHD2_9HEXA|nr:unnamed protein product [Allacma fusca]
MREIFSLLAFLIPWNFASSETFTGSSEWRNDTTLYDCIDASPHQGSGNLFTVPPNLNFESHSYIFPVIQSLKPLPCLGQPGHKRILSLTPSEVIFSPLGHIKVIGANVGGFGVIYNPEEYCIKRNFSLVEIHYCVSQCAQPNEPISVESDKRKEVCVPKCCLPGFIIDYNTNERCTRSAVDWTPTFYHASSVNTQRCIAEVERKQQPFYRLIHPNEGWCSIKILYPRIRLSADSLDRSRYLFVFRIIM